MFRWMHRALPLAALACAAARTADAPKIQVFSLPPATVQARLNAVPRKLADRVATLESMFHEAGCEGDRFAEQLVKHSKAPNLVCTLIGTSESEIVVGGHLDSIEAGMGAIDDWSGASLLPSLYQSLKEQPRKHRFVFVAFAAEEQGLVGSSQFVSSRKGEGAKSIRAMINLECLGVGPPVVWASRADKHLLDLYSQVASSLHIQVRGVNVERIADDDSHPFLNAGIPVLTIHSITADNLRLIHRPSDQVSAIQAEDYYNAYRLATLYLAYLDTVLD